MWVARKFGHSLSGVAREGTMKDTRSLVVFLALVLGSAPLEEARPRQR
jgi:hypothetical protein